MWLGVCVCVCVCVLGGREQRLPYFLMAAREAFPLLITGGPHEPKKLLA